MSRGFSGSIRMSMPCAPAASPAWRRKSRKQCRAAGSARSARPLIRCRCLAPCHAGVAQPRADGGAELVLPARHGGEAAFTALPVAGGEVEERRHEALLHQTRRDLVRVMVIGKEEFHGSETGPGGKRKAIEEGHLVEHHGHVGGETRHGQRTGAAGCPPVPDRLPQAVLASFGIIMALSGRWHRSTASIGSAWGREQGRRSALGRSAARAGAGRTQASEGTASMVVHRSPGQAHARRVI